MCEISSKAKFRLAVYDVLFATFYTLLSSFRRLESIKLFDEQINSNFEKRLARTVALLYKSGAPATPAAVVQPLHPLPHPQHHIAHTEETSPEMGSESLRLSLQVLEKKQDLNARKMETIRRKLKDISEVMSQFLNVIYEQDTMVGDILVKADFTTQRLRASNKHLSAAHDHAKSFGTLWALLLFSMGLALLFFDLVK